jgi:hypothetical protein
MFPRQPGKHVLRQIRQESGETRQRLTVVDRTPRNDVLPKRASGGAGYRGRVSGIASCRGRVSGVVDDLREGGTDLVTHEGLQGTRG